MPYESVGTPSGQKNQIIANGLNSNYALVESEITDLVLAEGRLEALRSLALMFLRELDNLKKIMGPKRARPWGDKIDLEQEMAAIEVAIIKHALLRSRGNQAAAARMLSINPTTLHAKMKKHGITANNISVVD
jgi:DNA-binding NtrC family response regulator